MKYSYLKYYKCLALLSLVLGTTSCLSEDPILSDGNLAEDGRSEMGFCANVSQQYVTRVNDNGFADGDKIGVFVVNYDNGTSPQLSLTGNHADNVKFTYNDQDGKWTGAYQLYWKDAKTPVDAYGYYPFDAELSSVTAYPYTIQRDQNSTLADTGITGYEASDFLWTKEENKLPVSGTINLHLKHLMAGVLVTLVEGSGFEDGEWGGLTKQVVIENTRLETTISLQTGVVSVDENSTVQSIIPMSSGTDFRAIVAPQVVSAGQNLISMTVGGVSYTFGHENDMTYNPGKIHKFSLMVSKNQLDGDYEFKLIDEAVLEWQNDPVSHNGTAREYITVHVEDGKYIKEVIESMGLNPKEITNLKLTGTLSDQHGHFDYIRDNMPYLEAINLKELRTKNQRSYYEDRTASAYDQPETADDYLPMNAFENMKFLSYVVWPDHLVGIAQYAFAGCNLRGSLIFPEGLKHIGNSAFEAWGHQCSSLTGELYLPSSLEYVGVGAFDPTDGKKCNLTGEFILPSNIKYIGDSAFGACHLLTGKVQIPESLKVLNKYSLPERLTGDVVIPQGIKVVNGVTGNISSVRFPEGVEEIGSGAFENAAIKGDIKFPSTLKKISNYAFKNTKISHISFPENEDFTILYEESFMNCKFLQDTLTLPSQLLQINSQAFEGCEKLTAVILPGELNKIGDNAFKDCRSLDYIRCLSVDPPTLAGSAFDGVEKNNFTVVVPPESVERYKAADGWKEFKRISGYRNFVCRPMKAELLNKGDVRTVVLNADGAWEISRCPEWATPSVTEGTGKTELTVTIGDLEKSSEDRNESIEFTLKNTSDEQGNPITCTFDITQYNYEYAQDACHILNPSSKGINVIFVGDGYSAKDISDGTYLSDVEEGVKYFFGIEPYNTYKDYFNVSVAFALSYESGVCSDVNIWRETKFNSTYGAGHNGRLSVDQEAVMEYVLNGITSSPVNAENIDKTLVICLMNSDVYEGVTYMYGNGAAVAFVPHSRYDYPNDYRGLIQHEACGHGFGKLADEYIYHREYIQTCDCTCCSHVDEVLSNKSLGWFRNISLSGKYSDIEWRDLIFHEAYDDIVDIYEGAYFHSRGVYRSEVNSCMNNNVPYFSTISRQAIVERIMEYAGEMFSFDAFVANDSREYGEITRSGYYDMNAGIALHSQAPVIVEGSPLDYIKTR